jgi:putative membrane protein
VFETLRSLFRAPEPRRRRQSARLEFLALEDRTVPAVNVMAAGPVPASALAADGQPSDTTFLTKVVQGDEQEMILGSLATVLGQSQAVRDFGTTLLQDHARMFATAMYRLNQQGMSLPALDAAMLQNVQNLAGLRGGAFDTAFTNLMVEDHTQDVQDFGDEAQNGQGTTRIYAANWQVIIQAHLQMAQSLQNSLGAGGTGGDTSGTGGTAAAPGTLSDQDIAFLAKAAQGDEQELILGPLATTVGRGSGVRVFGQTLIHDHALLLINAVTLLDQNGLTLQPPTADMLQNVQQIATRRGADFNQAFADYMVQDHAQDVQDFGDETRNGTDQQVKDLARNGLPAIQTHLHIAQSLQAQMSNNGNGQGNGQGNGNDNGQQ